MTQRTYTRVTGVLFLAIGALHLLRVIFQWHATIGDHALPMWASWLGLVIAGYLAFEGFRLAKKSP